MVSRYWFSTALGCVIVFAATVNYLNQPIEDKEIHAIASASVDIPIKADEQEQISSAAPLAAADPVGDLIALDEKAGQILDMPVQTATAAAEDGMPATAGKDQKDIAALVSDVMDDVENAGAEVAEASSSAAPMVADETAALKGTPTEVTPTEATSMAAAPTEVAPMEIASAGSGWLVETTGKVSPDQVGKRQTVMPAALVDDEVQAILDETAALAKSAVAAREGSAPPAPIVVKGESEVAALAAPADVAPAGESSLSSDPTLPAWERIAARVPPSDGPMVAVIIDDLGWSARRTGMVSALSSGLTMAMLTDTDDAPRQAAKARSDGHELLIHVAMQPEGAAAESPGQLTVGMSDEELRQSVDEALANFEGVIGINNHMGSLFTSDHDSMRVVLERVHQHGLIYVDSLTTPDSVADEVAAELGMPYLSRDVFLDNERDSGAILGQLESLERIAGRRGWAVAIGHPYIETIDALAAWIPTLERKGITLVPVSTLVRKTIADTQTASRPEG